VPPRYEQFEDLGERTGATVIAKAQGPMPRASHSRRSRREGRRRDILIMDTAGRLQNRTELMAELEKIVRCDEEGRCHRSACGAARARCDRRQNALSQASEFSRIAGITGLVMTKLDGTARGGILVALAAKHALPVHFIGVGEGVDDSGALRRADFANAIAGLRPLHLKVAAIKLRPHPEERGVAARLEGWPHV